MVNKKGPINNPAGRRVLVDRVFEAPIGLVFSMWTRPEYLARWWGPKGNINPVCEMDVRPGGSISIVMQLENGEVIHVMGVFNEVSAPDRLVFTTIKEEEGSDDRLEVLHTVALTEERGKTRLLMQVEIIETSAAFNSSCQGMELGWNQSFDRLAAQLIYG